MSKNIKLIAGAGLAVAAASTASVLNASAMTIAGTTGAIAEAIAAEAFNGTTHNISDGALDELGIQAVNGGSINISVNRDASENITGIVVNVNGDAETTAAVSTVIANLDLSDDGSEVLTNVPVYYNFAGTIAVQHTMTAKSGKGSITNSGTMSVVTGGSIVTEANSSFTNSGILSASAINGKITNYGTILVDAATTIAATAEINGGYIKVQGAALTIADGATVNSVLSIVADDATTPGAVHGSIKVVNAAYTVNIPANIAGTGVDGITYTFELLDDTETAGFAHVYSVDVDTPEVISVTVSPDNNEIEATDPDVTVFNKNTKLRDIINKALLDVVIGQDDTGADITLGAALADAGYEDIYDLTEDEIFHLVESAGITNNDGRTYNYFEGWYTDRNYTQKAELDANATKNTNLYAKLGFRNHISFAIGSGDDYDNDYIGFLGNLIVKDGTTYGDVIADIQKLLDTYNKENDTNYGIKDVYFLTVTQNGHRLVEIDNDFEFENYDNIYIVVKNKKGNVVASTTTKPAASVAAPATGAVSEAAGSASSSNIFAVVAGAIVALGAAVAKLFKKSER